MYSDYQIAFGEKGLCSFGNGFARNVIIFSIDNSLSSHSDKSKNNFNIKWRSYFWYNGSFSSPEKSLALTLVMQTQNFG